MWRPIRSKVVRWVSPSSQPNGRSLPCRLPDPLIDGSTRSEARMPWQEPRFRLLLGPQQDCVSITIHASLHVGSRTGVRLYHAPLGWRPASADGLQTSFLSSWVPLSLKFGMPPNPKLACLPYMSCWLQLRAGTQAVAASDSANLSSRKLGFHARDFAYQLRAT